MITVEVRTHGVTGRPVVEVQSDGNLVAMIYPNDEHNAIHVVSAHLTDDPIQPTMGNPPGFLINFNRR